MSKAVLISIRPKWCELIASGQKTVEVRKTAPNLDPPFKCYIYMTRFVWAFDLLEQYGMDDLVERLRVSTGKVIGEIICDAISPITFDRAGIPTLHYLGIAKNWTTCLTAQEAIKYCGDTEKHGLFGWHISDLVIYGKQKELREFTPHCKYMLDGMKCDPADVACLDQSDYEDDDGLCYCLNFVRRPPQSWCYVEELT